MLGAVVNERNMIYPTLNHNQEKGLKIDFWRFI